MRTAKWLAMVGGIGVVVMTAAGCDETGAQPLRAGTQATAKAAPTASPSPTEHPKYDEPTPPACSAWLSRGSHLRSAMKARYGEIDGCALLDHTWVVTTDQGSSGRGWIGVDVCGGDCLKEPPSALTDFTFYQPSKKPGTFERVAGTNPDGTILFIGGAGELAFNPSTRRFTPESSR